MTSTNSTIIRISEAKFEETRAAFEAGETREGIRSEVAYRVEGDSVLWAWSPDGLGVFWYDSLNELLAQHG